MTLVLAMKWSIGEDEAVLVTSDSRATTPVGIAYEVKKIHPIVFGDDKPVAIASGSGEGSLVKWGFEIAEEQLLTCAQKEYPVRYETIRNAVRSIEKRFVQRLSELRGYRLEPDFQMILCGLDLHGKAWIYLFNNAGLAEPVHGNPGYAIIGSGFITGGILLLRLLGLTPGLDLGLLTTFILDTVSEVDTAVGPFVGESYLMRIGEKEGKRELNMGPLTAEALVDFKKRSAKRKELIGRLWRLCDEVGEEKMEDALNSLLAKLEKATKRKARGKDSI